MPSATEPTLEPTPGDSPRTGPVIAAASAGTPGADALLDTIRVGCTIVIVALVSLRCVTMQVAQRVFDIDPMLAMMPQAAIGPSFGLGIDAALLLTAGIALLAERRTGRCLDPRLLWLALLPAAPILWHGVSDIGGLARGMTWLAAIVAAVTMAHLGRDRRLRRLALGALLAIAAPLALRGGHQIVVEHPATVAHYEATRAAFLADRGWAPDSAAARLYERRLYQPEATGWFGLSNVLSSIVGAVAVILLASLRPRDFRGQVGGIGLLVAAIGVAAAVVLLVNSSKGAIGAALIGVAVALLVVLPPRVRRVVEAHAPRLGVALVGCALLAVVVRGVVLPEGFADERSLLFRWHYLVNSARLIPTAPLVGVGPDGFQDAYVMVRDARHVEEVTNAHSVFVDWIVALGVVGWAWVILTLLALRSAGSSIAGRSRDAADSMVDPAGRDPIGVRTGRLAAVAALLPAVAGVAIELSTLDGASFMLRILGALGWVGGAAALAAHGLGFLDRLDAPRRYALFAGVVVLAVHAQIEMTLWLAGSVGWIAVLGATVAAGGVGRVSVTRRSNVASSVAIAATAMLAGSVLFAAFRMAGSDGALLGAAVPLERLGVARVQLRVAATAPTANATARVESAFRDAGLPEPTIAAVVARLHHVEAGQRAVGERTAIEALREREIDLRRSTAEALEAAPRRRGDPRALLAASEQWMRLASMTISDGREVPLRRALDAADAAIELAPRIRTRRQRAEALDAIARTTERHQAWIDAALAWRDVIRRDPQGLSNLLRFAEAAWAAGDAVEAERAWRRALEIDEALDLDPPRRLSAERRAEVIARLSTIAPPPRAPRHNGETSDDDPEPGSGSPLEPLADE